MIDHAGDLNGLLLVDPGGGIYDLPETAPVFTWTEQPPGYRRWQRSGTGPPYRYCLERLELDATEIRARIHDLLWQAAKEYQGRTVEVDVLKAVDKLKELLGRPVKTLVMSRATWRERFVDPERNATGMRLRPTKPWARLLDQVERRRVVLIDSGPIGCVFGAGYPEDTGVLAVDFAGRTSAAIFGPVVRIMVRPAA
jgi:hypothetical protein